MSNYFDSYVVLGDKQIVYSTRGGLEASWQCFFHGELIGKIEYQGHRPTWEKPYEALILDIDSDWERYNHIGWFNTLFEAKIALLTPARKVLEHLLSPTGSTAPAHLLTDVDSEFYPTPSALAGMLMAGIDWLKVNSILEPSAGTGSLLDYVKRLSTNYNHHCKYARLDISDIDCIELNSNLRSILAGKGYRVVHDDFLDYYTHKRYDLILMNPPFSEGDMHLLHAIELCRNGGQIACILNAETIRNPHTNSRKALAKELKRHNASIRYMKNAFAHASRRSSVEVALINLTIPEQSSDSSIWDSLQKAADVQIDGEPQFEIAPGNQIERLIREYQLLCDVGIELMQKYNGVAPHIHDSSTSSYSQPIITLSIADQICRSQCSNADVNRFLQRARSRYWSELFALPELRSKMTSAMHDRYQSTITEMRDYEFSPFNIQQVLDKIRSQLLVGIDDAILKCFDKLSAEHTYNTSIQNDNIHYFNGWKSNKAHYVNNHCIIPTYGCFARNYKPDKYGRYKEVLEGLDVRGCFSVLSDLEKALDYLDKGETFHRDLEIRLTQAANAGKTASIPCKYFTVTFYKKGTCHIKFHDSKIVDRLNIYVGRKRAWLPPTYGKVRYDEMDVESRRVVDDFQGRTAYEEVMENPSDYIIETHTFPLLIA